MSSVIKSSDRNRGLHGVAFNLDDVRGRAEALLEQAREQARKLLAAAMQQSHEIRKQAEAEGRRQGEAAIEAIVDRQLAEKMLTVHSGLQQAIDRIEAARPAWIASWEQQAVSLAVAIAARVIRRELRQTADIPLSLVREALELCSGSGANGVRVLLNPQDHATLRGEVATLTTEFSRLGTAEIVADPDITPGGCRVETRHGSIDQQIEQQLARIEAELK